MEQITYTVTIEETLNKIIEIKADNIEEAEKTARQMYKNEEIILYPEDHTQTMMQIESYEECTNWLYL